MLVATSHKAETRNGEVEFFYFLYSGLNCWSGDPNEKGAARTETQAMATYQMLVELGAADDVFLVDKDDVQWDAKAQLYVIVEDNDEQIDENENNSDTEVIVSTSNGNGSKVADGIAAKYPGKCALTGETIEVGDMIVGNPHGSGWVHVDAAKNAGRPVCSRCEGDLDEVWRGCCKRCRHELRTPAGGWDANAVLEALKYDNEYLERAIMRLWSWQTADEQEVADTRHKNGRGFNAADARALSRSARWIERGNHVDGHHLVVARKRVMKYVGQLLAYIERIAKDDAAVGRGKRDASGEPVKCKGCGIASDAAARVGTIWIDELDKCEHCAMQDKEEAEEAAAYRMKMYLQDRVQMPLKATNGVVMIDFAKVRNGSGCV